MKIKYLALTVLIVISLTIIDSCSDNSVSTTTPAGTVFFSQDSMGVWIQPIGSGTASGSDTIYYSTQNTGGVKVEFTLLSNADSIHSIGYWALYTNATPGLIPAINPVFSPVVDTALINFNFASGTTYFSLAVRFSATNSTVSYYLKLRNVKITKL